MTLADAQQQRLLERLRRAGHQPVAFAELYAGGVDFPAAVVCELELNGYLIDRVYDHGRLAGVRLLDPEPTPARASGAARTDSQPPTRRDHRGPPGYESGGRRALTVCGAGQQNESTRLRSWLCYPRLAALRRSEKVAGRPQASGRTTIGGLPSPERSFYRPARLRQPISFGFPPAPSPTRGQLRTPHLVPCWGEGSPLRTTSSTIPARGRRSAGSDSATTRLPTSKAMLTPSQFLLTSHSAS
jgi:hypothetical protein